MGILGIAWRSIRQRPLTSLLTSLSLALGVALVVATIVTAGLVHKAFESGAGLGYNMIIGAKGSPLQLVLNSVYFISKPIENLPWGVAERSDRPGEPRIMVAIGDAALDVAEAAGFGMLEGLAPRIVSALRMPTLNAFMALGRADWSAARAHVATMLSSGGGSIERHPRRDAVLLDRAALAMRLPAEIGDYTDFYASEHHATNVGSMFRPNQPLMPNWKHLPVGYHGRASSIVVDGTPVRRPHGQTVAADDGPPSFGPSKLLDHELEMGVFFGGEGNALGTRIPVARAAEHLFGLVILNDWSARDVQK